MSRPRCFYCGIRTASVLTWRRCGIVTCRPCSDLIDLDPNRGMVVDSPVMPLTLGEELLAARETGA